jgi:hypothetical protein
MHQQQEHQICTCIQAKTHITDLEHAMSIMEQETANAIFNEESGQVLKYRMLLSNPKYKEVWSHSSANEFGRLAQGVGTRIQGTNTIFFVSKNEIPFDCWKDVTYGKSVCEYKPNKAKKSKQGSLLEATKSIIQEIVAPRLET